MDDAYYEAIISWFFRRHGWRIDRGDILPTTSVVPALSCCVKALAMPGDQVLMLSPVYTCFFTTVRNNGCQVLECPLVPCGDSFEVDWDAFEACCADERTSVFLLCNPHNPVSRVWTREELVRMNDICLRHGVIVVSDEIHCEIVMPGYRYTPFASIDDACRDNAVVLNSPSKSFNTPGLHASNFVCHNPEWRRRLAHAAHIHEVRDATPFGPVGLIAAYNESEDWIDALCPYIQGNFDLLRETLVRDVPGIGVTRLEGTYLAWVDCRRVPCAASLPAVGGGFSDALSGLLLREAHVQLSSGTLYGPVTGDGYMRVNLATQRSRLEEALRRMVPVLCRKG